MVSAALRMIPVRYGAESEMKDSDTEIVTVRKMKKRK
jgi:hypothetical protein